MSIDERYFTVEEIAERVKVTPATVRRWLREGAMRGHNFGGRTGWRITEKDVNDFLRTHSPLAQGA